MRQPLSHEKIGARPIQQEREVNMTVFKVEIPPYRELLRNQ
jgi:hypothetical protein